MIWNTASAHTQSRVEFANAALGNCRINSAKIRESFGWALQHDTHPAVRAEAIRAVYNLGLLESDALIKDAVLTLMTTDSSNKVREEAEFVLVKAGIMHKGMGEESTDVRKTVDGTLVQPYPHLFADKTKEEAQIYLRHSLVGDQEAIKVIDQVRSLSTKEAVFHQVEEMSVQTEKVQVHGLDLEFDSPFRPQLKEIHKPKGKKRYERSITTNSEGLPTLKATN
jgi:hypothetical protein